jgi:hypothetical protein
MENQVNVGDQNTQQIGQNPLSQPVISPEKPKTNWPLIGGIVLACFVVFGFGGYYLGKQSTNFQLTTNLDQQTPTPTESLIPSIPTTTNTPVINKTTLVEALTKNCVNNKVTLDKLPFGLSQSVKTAYKVQNTVDCYVPEESYARISIVINNAPEFSGDDRYIYFFHQDSQFQGMGNDFQSLSNYKPVTISGQNLYLNVRDPGPYGISTLGVWVDFIGEKKDPSTGTIVRAFNLEIFKGQDILDLVKKYGVKQTDPSGPEYVITDPNKKTQFIQEIISLAGQHTAFKKPAQDVSSDLNGVSF